MTDQAKLQQIRDLAKAKILELQPFAGGEMTLPQTDPHRDGFIDGERTLAARILALACDQPEAMAERWVAPAAAVKLLPG